LIFKIFMNTYLTSVMARGLLGFCLGVATCAVAQDAKEPFKLLLKVEAAAQSNPDETGRPSPVKVRVYELKDSNTFSEADYFSLNANDKSVLGSDLLSKVEMILRPGETKRIERKSHPQATSIGILAGYRDMNSLWRVVEPLPEAPTASWLRKVMPGKKVELLIQLQPHGIVVVPAP
jgi:type VI secretion system protein VasD